MVKLKEKYLYNLYFLMFSLYLTLNLLTIKDLPGDQDWFRQQFINYDGNVLKFAYERYFSWSGRLLIESAMALFSNKAKLFYIIAFLSYFLFFYFVFKLICKNKNQHSRYFVILMPIIFLFYFPPRIFTSAGLIATFTAYFLPITSLLVAYNLKEKKSVILNVFTFLLLIFSLMLEQLTLINLLISLYLIVDGFCRKGKINYKNLAFFILSVIYIFIIKLSPGNAIRTVQETQSWFPNFLEIGLLNRINLCFLETNRVLFTQEYGFVTIFLMSCAILAYSLGHKRLFMINILLSVLLLLQKDNILNPFMLVEQPGYIRLSNGNYAINYDNNFFLLITIYSSFLFVVCITLYRLFKLSMIKWNVIGLILVGYASRMLMALSPTLYASLERTFLPFIACVFIINMVILNDILEKNNKGVA